MIEWYVRFKTKRQLKRSAKMLRVFLDNAPSKVFENLIYRSDGTPLDSNAALNELSIMIDRVERM